MGSGIRTHRAFVLAVPGYCGEPSYSAWNMYVNVGSIKLGWASVSKIRARRSRGWICNTLVVRVERDIVGQTVSSDPE